MTNRNIHLLAVLFLTFASGCASMAHRTRETIEANSDPTGADVAIDCGGQRVASGVTPTRLTMRRKLEGCEARFSKEGFARGTSSDAARLQSQLLVHREHYPGTLMTRKIP